MNELFANTKAYEELNAENKAAIKNVITTSPSQVLVAIQNPATPVPNVDLDLAIKKSLEKVLKQINESEEAQQSIRDLRDEFDKAAAASTALKLRF